jgi:hypothetical protein
VPFAPYNKETQHYLDEFTAAINDGATRGCSEGCPQAMASVAKQTGEEKELPSCQLSAAKLPPRPDSRFLDDFTKM